MEDVAVVDEASKSRLGRICEAIDGDVSSKDGGNMVFNLATKAPNETGLMRLKRVLSLGARPDIPNRHGQLPLEEAFLLGKKQTVAALAMCRPSLIARKPENLNKLKSVSM